MKQKFDFDRPHRARLLPELPVRQSIWISNLSQRGKVEKLHGSLRSYVVRSPSGVFRRNRKSLHPIPDAPVGTEVVVPDLKQEEASEEPKPPVPPSPVVLERYSPTPVKQQWKLQLP